MGFSVLASLALVVDRELPSLESVLLGMPIGETDGPASDVEDTSNREILTNLFSSSCCSMNFEVSLIWNFYGHMDTKTIKVTQ